MFTIVSYYIKYVMIYISVLKINQIKFYIFVLVII